MSKSIKEMRQYLNLSQQELANVLCVTPTTISSWECGRKKPRKIYFKILEEICDEHKKQLCKTLQK